MRRSRHEVLGIVLIVLGILLLFDSLGFATFDELFRTYWPVILVLLGIWFLIGRGTGRREEREEPLKEATAPKSGEEVFDDVRQETSASHVRHSNVFGDLDVRVTSQAFTGGSVTNVFGDVRFDMRTVALAPGEHRVQVSGVFGDVVVIMPLGAEYAFEGSLLAGDVSASGLKKSGFGANLKTETPGFRTAAQRMVVHASGVFGSIIVH